MKKYLSIIVGLVMVLGASPIAFALNDLTLQTSAVISAGATFTVSGDNNTMDSITVDTASFTVTFSPNGKLIVTAPAGTAITSSQSSAITADRICDSATSRLQLVAKSTASAETVTISAGGACGGSSGGEPNAAVVTTTADTTTTTTDTTIVVPATTTTTAAAATTPAATTPAVTTPVVTAPVVTSTPAASVSTYTFSVPLKLGSEGTEVTELQKVLVAKGYLTMPAGVAYGTFGNLTQSAVKKYQAANGIDQLGNVGPATRASLNASVVPPVSTSQTSSATIETLQAQLQALQAQLLLLLSQQVELLKAQQ